MPVARPKGSPHNYTRRCGRLHRSVATFFETTTRHLNGRQRRIVAGALAEAFGRGSQALVVEASGMSTNTMWKAVRDVRRGIEPDERVRRAGAGAKRAIETQPGLLKALDELVHPSTRGNPMSTLRWTLKSTYELARELTEEGFKVSAELVRRLLHHMGYSLQAPAKENEGTQHPDRDGQFHDLNDQATKRLEGGEPVISVDRKKKGLIGNFRWTPKMGPDDYG